MSELRDLLLQKLPEIERLVASICRRSGMDADAIEEFEAEVKLRLVEKDYAILRAFQGRSSFSVYMAAVIKRMLLDRHNHEWGKWRPSADAQRLGPVAVELERLLYRDKRSMEEAAVLLAGMYEGASRSELDRLATLIPRRTRRVKVDVEEAAAVSVSPADRSVAGQLAQRISAVVVAFIDRLPEDEQLLLLLRFHATMTVAQIARALKLDQQVLYRQLYRHFAALRTELMNAGIAADDVEELIGSDTVVLDFNWEKNRKVRPSGEDERAVAARPEESS